jgi:hypothetical protein
MRRIPGGPSPSLIPLSSRLLLNKNTVPTTMAIKPDSIIINEIMSAKYFNVKNRSKFRKKCFF